MPSPSTALLTVDLDALAHNLGVLRAHAGEAEVAAVVKGDGYGLGVGPVARRLHREGVRSFFVARLAEGVALRGELGRAQPARIHVLDGLAPGAEAAVEEAGLTPVLCTRAQVEAAGAAARAGGRPFDVALQIDTGMHRQGLTPDEAMALAAAPGKLDGLSIGLVMSHLGCAAMPGHPRNGAQLARFDQVRALFPQARASLAASAGTFLGQAYRFDLVRPGISLYGGGPFERPDPRFLAVATLQAPLLDIRQVPAGELVSYGDGVRLAAPTRLGIVGAGYADGVIRAAKGAGHAWLDGAPRRLVMVNMDVLAIDLGDGRAQVGDLVEILGRGALLDDLALAAGSVPHEVLARLSARAERRYLGGD